MDRVRGYRETEPYRKAIRKGKAWHGIGRFRLRTLRRVNAEALLVAAGQNLKRLLSLGGGRPKEPPAQAALLHRCTLAAAVPARKHHAKPPRPSWRSFCNTLHHYQNQVRGRWNLPVYY